MSGRILYGKPVADALRAEYEPLIQRSAWKRTLTVIKDDTSDKAYLKALEKAADEWKIHIHLVSNIKDAAKLGASYIVSLLDRGNLLGFAASVDGQNPLNDSEIYNGRIGRETPCTAEAIVRVLDWYKIPIAGKEVLILGRSNRVGKPAAMLMLTRDATVTICHSKTPPMAMKKNLANADIIVCATGVQNLLHLNTQERYMDSSQVVINVGGDFTETIALKGKSVDLCPYKGGVGAVTAAVLMSHCYQD